MAQTMYVAMTDVLKVELSGNTSNNGCFEFRVYELINGTWHYLDSGDTTLTVNSSDGQIRHLMESMASEYSDYLSAKYQQTAGLQPAFKAGY